MTFYDSLEEAQANQVDGCRLYYGKARDVRLYCWLRTAGLINTIISRELIRRLGGEVGVFNPKTRGSSVEGIMSLPTDQALAELDRLRQQIIGRDKVAAEVDQAINEVKK